MTEKWIVRLLHDSRELHLASENVLWPIRRLPEAPDQNQFYMTREEATELFKRLVQRFGGWEREGWQSIGLIKCSRYKPYPPMAVVDWKGFV